jgi:ribosomal-protein-alanine N-acetyltransferase
MDERTVRPMKYDEVDLMINYFLDADQEFLNGLGVDPEKLPGFDEWRLLLKHDYDHPLEKRRFFYLIWELEGTPVGHSNIGDIIYGHEAYMHLHLWAPGKRRHGHGSQFVRKSIKVYFQTFNLNRLFCQPYSHNTAPNKTLAKAGFEFIETLNMVPSWINFHQSVNKWILTKERFEKLIGN